MYSLYLFKLSLYMLKLSYQSHHDIQTIKVEANDSGHWLLYGFVLNVSRGLIRARFRVVITPSSSSLYFYPCQYPLHAILPLLKLGYQIVIRHFDLSNNAQERYDIRILCRISTRMLVLRLVTLLQHVWNVNMKKREPERERYRREKRKKLPI